MKEFFHFFSIYSQLGSTQVEHAKNLHKKQKKQISLSQIKRYCLCILLLNIEFLWPNELMSIRYQCNKSFSNGIGTLKGADMGI